MERRIQNLVVRIRSGIFWRLDQGYVGFFPDPESRIHNPNFWELSEKIRYLLTVLRIRDVYPGSRILIFIHPGSRNSDPGSRIQKQQQKRGVKKNLLS